MGGHPVDKRTFSWSDPLQFSATFRTMDNDEFIARKGSDDTSVTFQLAGFNVGTREFTEDLGVQPTFVRNGLWVFSTQAIVNSSGVNSHIRFLLLQFLLIAHNIRESSSLCRFRKAGAKLSRSDQKCGNE
jgi:hypothetical protein